jgi:hypothetical protein
MKKTTVITFSEVVYLLYMYFIFKTSYTFSGASFEKQTESLGQMFVHDTGHYENKICVFGKIMAIIAVILATFRANVLINYPTSKNVVIAATIGFDLLCISLAYIMNLNALVYIIPLIFAEVYLFS